MKNLFTNQGFPCGNGAPSLKRKGFTLVELLIVITILAALATLAFFGFGKAKERAKSASCASNLRQIGVAMVSYAAEHNNQLPALEAKNSNGSGNGIWTVLLAREGYLWDTNIPGKPKLGTGVWACPNCDYRNDNQRGYGVVESTIFQYDDRLSTVNSRLGKTEKGSLRLNTIEEPSRTWLVGCTAETAGNLSKSWFAIWPQPTRWQSSHTPAARHNGKVNVCMVDGHVEALTMQQLMDGNYTMYK